MAHTAETRLRAYEKMKQRRKEYFDINGPCVRCGSFDNLELDHIDPTEKEDHKVWSWSEERRRIELAKCQVLCESCHLEKTKEYFQIYFVKKDNDRVCGTVNKYWHGHCRCDLCKAAHREWRHDQYLRLGT